MSTSYDLQNLIQDMWELQRAAGRPSMRTIAHESVRVAAACHTKGFRDASQLTPTTIYDTLNGKRKGPPRWAWLSVYVLTCREIARRSPGLHDEMSDEEVLAFVVDRYGEFVLFRPPFTWKNAALWLSGPAILLLGGTLAFAFIRRRSRAAPPRPAPLSPDEKKRVAALLKE